MARKPQSRLYDVGLVRQISLNGATDDMHAVVSGSVRAACPAWRMSVAL